MGTDETTPENTLNEVEAALEKGVDLDDPNITSKLEELKRKLGVQEDSVVGEPGPSQHLGKDVDWSDYDLDPKFAHLYPQSRLEMTEQGPRWVVDITEFIAIKQHYDKIGRQITQMINGPEGWRLQSAVVPVNSNTGVATLQRMFPIILPQPNMLKSEESVTPPPPTEEELAAMETEALAWANGDGTPPPPSPTPQKAEYPDNDTADAMADLAEAKVEEFQPMRSQVIPGAIAASKEYHDARAGDPDRPND